MENEFTDWCNYYYQLSMLYSDIEKHLKNLLNNAPLYCGQTRLSEIDAIIGYYSEVQAELSKWHKMREDAEWAEFAILEIMRQFEIPPGTVLSGEIPGEMAYEVWADEQDRIHISKTGDLAPGEDDFDTIVIKCSGF